MISKPRALFWRLCWSPIGKKLPKGIRVWLQDAGTSVWCEGANQTANDAAEYCACSGWQGFYGYDKDGRKWRVVGTLVSTNQEAVK